MPGKVNPVICESLIQISAQVIGYDTAITLGGLGGVFELNLMLPLIAHNILESINILSNGTKMFRYISALLNFFLGYARKYSDIFYAYFYEFALIKSYIKNLNLFSFYIKFKLSKFITNNLYNFNSKKKNIFSYTLLSKRWR